MSTYTDIQDADSPYLRLTLQNSIVLVGGTSVSNITAPDFNLPFLDGTTGFARFNGTNDQFRINAATGMNSSEFTFEAWIWVDSSGTGTRWISIRGNDVWQNMILPDNRLEFNIINTGNVHNTVTTDASVPTDQWVHVAHTYVSGDQRAYINGEIAAQVANTGAIRGDIDPMWIGSWGGGGYFKGGMAYPAHYKSALSAERIKARADYFLQVPEGHIEHILDIEADSDYKVPVRVTSLQGEVITQSDSSARVTNLRGEVITQSDSTVRISNLVGEVMVRARSGVTVGEILDLRWSNRARTAAELDLRWQVLYIATIAQDSILQWANRGRIPVARALEWSISRLMRSDSSAQWAILTSLTEAIDNRWGQRELATALVVTTWSARAARGARRTVSWIVDSGIASLLALDWGVRTKTTSEVSSNWGQRALTRVLGSLAWNSRALAMVEMETIWQARIGFGIERSVQWSLRRAIPSESNQRWTQRLLSGRQLRIRWRTFDNKPPILNPAMTVEVLEYQVTIELVG